MRGARFQGEIITTGNELISGRVADVNARYAARRLSEAGLGVQAITILGDAAPLLQETLRLALGRSRFVIVTGGLGPTEDDITAAVAAEILARPLRSDDYLLARIKACLAARGLPWEEKYARMALIPEGACILDPGGSACGFFLCHEGVWLYFLPGVPREMQFLFDHYVLPPLLQAAAGGEAVCSRTLRFFGLKEVELEELCQQLNREQDHLTVGYYPRFPENLLTLTLRGGEKNDLEQRLDALTQTLANLTGQAYLGLEEQTLEQQVGDQLRQRQWSLAVAESCSGGLICHRITNVPGSSDYFMGGVVTYSNQAKMELLQVPAAILTAYGAVSAETAAAMVQGVVRLFQTHTGLAATGIAGPSGGSAAKPVGTVYLGLATPNGVQTRHCRFHGSREEIKVLTAQTALAWLRQELQ